MKVDLENLPSNATKVYNEQKTKIKNNAQKSCKDAKCPIVKLFNDRIKIMQLSKIF